MTPSPDSTYSNLCNFNKKQLLMETFEKLPFQKLAIL